MNRKLQPNLQDDAVPKKRGRPKKMDQTDKKSTTAEKRKNNDNDFKIYAKSSKKLKIETAATSHNNKIDHRHDVKTPIDEPGPSKRQKLENSDNIDGSCFSTDSKPNALHISKCKSTQNIVQPWNEPQLLSEFQNIDRYTAANIIKLFKEDNTIPFMCRYRKELIGNDMTPDRLRDIKITFNHILNIKSRAETIIRNLEKEQKLSDEIHTNLLCAKSLDELDHLYAPYKPASKASLAERAKNLGLQSVAEKIFFGNEGKVIDLSTFVQSNVEGLETVDKVSDGIKHIISHLISKDTQVLDEIRSL